MTSRVVLDPRRNSLNALRLALATAVLVSHAWPLGGRGGDPGLGDENLGGWAVAGFFALSGYLVTGSRLSAPTSWDFLARRVLRIYPAFLVVLLVVAFVFAPVSTLVDGSHGYDAGASARFVVANLGLHVRQFDIPGTLTTAPYPFAWDGALWTLSYEFACYLGVGALVALVPRARLGAGVVVVLVLGTLGSAAHLLRGADDGPGAQLVRLGTYFAAGALLYLLRDRIPLTAPAAALAAGLVVVTVLTGTFQVLAGLPLAYLLLYAAAALPLHGVGRANDVSYGMYLYGFPVQQLIVVVLGPGALPVAAYVVLSVAATVPFAWASWCWVERPAMRLRNRLRAPHVRSVLSPSSDVVQPHGLPRGPRSPGLGPVA